MGKRNQRQSRPLRFGVVTPTFQRTGLLPRFVEQLERQNYDHWVAAIVHDGPSARFRRFTNELRDERILFAERGEKSSDAGASVRRECIRMLEERGVDYVLFWDDDNLFFPHALSAIAKDLRHFRRPDVLLVPIYWRRGKLPENNVTDISVRGVDSANMVVRTDLAKEACDHVAREKWIREHDYQAFEFLRQTGSRIVMGRTVVGDYDGLRRLPKVLRRVGVPEAVIYWSPVTRIQRSLSHVVRQNKKKLMGVIEGAKARLKLDEV